MQCQVWPCQSLNKIIIFACNCIIYHNLVNILILVSCKEGSRVLCVLFCIILSYLIVCLFECLSINRIECWIEVRKRNIAVSVKCLILFPRRPVIQDCQLKLTDNQYKVNLILPNFLLNWVACNLLTFQINYFKTFSINFSDPLKWINEIKKLN